MDTDTKQEEIADLFMRAIYRTCGANYIGGFTTDMFTVVTVPERKSPIVCYDHKEGKVL